MKYASLVELMGIAEDLGRRTAEREEIKQAPSLDVCVAEPVGSPLSVPKTKDGWKSALIVAGIVAGSMTLIGQIIEHFKNKPEPETVSRSYVGSSSNSGSEENSNSDIGPIRYRVIEDNSGGNNSRLEKKADSDSRAKQAKQYDAVYLDAFRKAVELNPGPVVAKSAPETSVIELSSVQKEWFSMAELADCYRISGVKYRNDAYVVDVSKALLENGAKKTQDGWIVYSKNALKNNGFVVGSLPMYHAIFSELEEHKNSPAYSGAVTSLIDFLNKPIREPGYATLTRIEYNRSKKSWIIHNVGMPDAQTIIKEVDLGDKKDQGTTRIYASRFSTSVAGTRTWRSMTSEDCNTLFGSSNVSSVYSSLFNQDEFAWGFKLDGQVIAVVSLGSKQNSFVISDNNNAALPAWGLRFTKQSESKEAVK